MHLCVITGGVDCGRTGFGLLISCVAGGMRMCRTKTYTVNDVDAANGQAFAEWRRIILLVHRVANANS